jgi:hypothetical protein
MQLVLELRSEIGGFFKDNFELQSLNSNKTEALFTAIKQSNERGLLLNSESVDTFNCVTNNSAVMIFEMIKNLWNLVILVVCEGVLNS